MTDLNRSSSMTGSSNSTNIERHDTHSDETTIEHDHSNPNQNDSSQNYSRSSSPLKPSFESIQKIIGESGRWQFQVVLLASFSGFCSSIHNLIYGFIGAVPEHWCRVPDWPTNYSKAQLQKKLTSNISAPDTQCFQHPGTWNNATDIITIDLNSSVPCTLYEFDRSEFHSTVATEWNLVCEHADWASYIQVTYMLGHLLGGPFFGAISDRQGRKTALLIAILIAAISSPLIAFSNSFAIFLVLRFILASTLPGIFDCSYVLALEAVSDEWRSTVGSLFSIPFAFGYTSLPVLAYFFRSWKALQLACSLPVILLLGTWWFLPESPRWLIGTGRLEKVEQILRNAAKVNGNENKIPSNFSILLKDIYDGNRQRDQGSKSFRDKLANIISDYVSIIKSPRMRTIFLILCYCWCIISLTYYGLGLNSSNLLTDRYLYVFINGLLEFPAYLMVPVFLKFIGRKPLFLGFTWACAAAMLLSTCLPPGSLAIVLLSYLGKLMIGANFSLVYLYSSEMLPTLVRNFVLGVCCMMGTIGSAIAPLIVDVVGRYDSTYPVLIYGCLAVIAGFLCLLLPETRDRPLPETIQEVEVKRVMR